MPSPATSSWTCSETCKLVDLLGDLYLLGRPVLGRVFAFYTGHRHNYALAHSLMLMGQGR